ncbi:hypothetical protein FND36_12820 [Lachnospiraceae bacterium KGMB03038]|nr:hypothetical protein FND36_12820 [Lachnospiraceae bacterium KGMB03038]
MALLAEIYLNVLKDHVKGFYGYRNTQIHQIDYFIPKKPLRPNCLYIGDVNLKAPKDPSICVLLADKNRVPKVYKEAESLLMNDYRRSSSMTLLGHAVLKEETLEEQVCIAHMVMENPVCFAGPAFQTVASSTKKMGRFQSSSLRFGRNLYNDQIFLLGADDTNPCRRLVGRCELGGVTTGYIIVEEMENKFCDALDLRYMKFLMELYAAQFYKDQEGADTREGAFLRGLLQGTLDDGIEIHCKLKQLNLPENEKYYLLAVDRSTNYSPMVKERLSAILGREIYSYDNYYLAILGYGWNQELREEEFPSLIQYLSAEKLRAGVSYGFFDYENLKTAFEQCKKTLAISKNKKKNMVLSRYEDNMIAHLLEIASGSGVPVTSLCHPTCLKIYEYDQKNGSSFLDTLAAYILSGENLQVTAQKLFVHRNTVYHRIETLKERFNLNLNDPRMFTKLQISIRIFTYLNIRDFTIYMGTESEEE